MYKNLSECNDYEILLKNFSPDMLSYFEKQLIQYLNGSNIHSSIVCWWENLMSTEELINQCKEE